MPLSRPKLSGPVPLYDLLGQVVRTQADELALVAEEKSWTWRNLARDIDTLAAHLVAMELEKGDRVASLMPNCGELLVFYLACLKAGLVVTPLNYRYTPPSIDFALGASGTRMLFVHNERSADVAASELAGGLSRGLISVGGALSGSKCYETLIETDAPKTDFPEPDLTATAFIFFTSGSTGTPKGVMHSIFSFGSVTASFAQAMCLTQADVVFPGGSISHVGSLSTALAALSIKAKVILATGFDGDTVLPLLRRQRPTILVALPAALIGMMHDRKTTRDDFSSLRLCISGGDKFPIDLEKAFVDLTGVEITETYGLTEATDCMIGRTNGEAKSGSVGQVCPGFSASIRDNSGQEVTEGNLWLAGDPLFLGYWSDPETTTQSFSDGWFYTGDVMRVDSEGNFWFRGRTKQIIVHDGSNIAPQEVEEAVMLHPAVELAGVIGLYDARHGENVWAYVSLKDGATAPPIQEIIEVARKQIGYKAPEVIIILNEIPLNASGKVDRVALKNFALTVSRDSLDQAFNSK